MAKAPKLTDKQRAFCEAYLKCFNATKAAKEAGYSEKSAAELGYQTLHRPSVQAFLRARWQESAMSSDELLHHLAQIARGDFSDLADDYGMLDMGKAKEAGVTNLLKRVRNKSFTSEEGATLESEVEAYDRMKALELIGRNLSIWNDKIKIEGMALKQLELLAQLAAQKDIPLSDMFQAMIQQFADAESESK